MEILFLISIKRIAGIFLLICEVKNVISHGRMMDPPARNCMWRFGYSNPVNYDDNQNWCGGAAIMINQNKGKCGVCGDNYADHVPRAHEAGGMYGNAIVAKRYAPGQVIDVEIELTANHQGTFEFKMCPASNPRVEITQACLDNHRLELLDARGKIKDQYVIISPEKKKTFYIKVKLPEGLSCSQCVLQWTYVAANTWGTCPNGTEAVGCGPQETFKNCADVAIIPNTGGRPPTNYNAPPTALFYDEDMKTGEWGPLVVRSQVCIAKQPYSSSYEMNGWCQENCLRYPPNCPQEKCQCLKSCDPVGNFKNEPGSDVFCLDHCLTFPPSAKCSADKCICY